MATKAEKTRQYIIEQTAPVFNAKGYAGTSLTDLMNATGLTKGSIYGNFENKDEVALAAFDYNFGNIASYLRAQIIQRDNSIHKLLVYPETYRHFLKLKFLQAGCPLLNTAIEADDTHPQLRARALHALHTWKTSLENILSEGIRKKEIRRDTDASEFATVMMSMIEGGIMQAKLTGKQTNLTLTMDYLEKMIRQLAR